MINKLITYLSILLFVSCTIGTQKNSNNNTNTDTASGISLIIKHHSTASDTTENISDQITNAVGAKKMSSLKKLKVIGSINELEMRAIAHIELDELDYSECKVVGKIHISTANDEITAYEPQFQNGNAIPYSLYSMNIESPKKFIFPKELTTIGAYAFYMSKLERNLDIPEGVVFILSEAFGRNKNLSALTLPSSLKYIGVQAFQFCENINTKVTFPDSLIHIGYRAFRGCDGIIRHGTEFPFDIYPIYDEPYIENPLSRNKLSNLN